MYLAYYWKALLVFIHMSLTAASLSKNLSGLNQGSSSNLAIPKLKRAQTRR